MPTTDRRLISVVWLHIAFAATGFGTTLLGCLLPALHSAWNLTDARAGFLFACQFTGASLGALLVREDLFGSIQHGYLVMVAGALALGTLHSYAAAGAFVAFGIGMGMAMTAINMVGGTVFEHPGAALSLLNASWIVGAALSPAIATRWVRFAQPMQIYFAVAVALAAIAFIFRHYRASLLGNHIRRLRVSEGATPWLLITGFSLLGFLYVGVEVSVSGWMMTFVHRLPIGGGLWAALITSCFWLAILCGRLLAPAILLRMSESRLLLASMIVACCSVISILLNHSPVAILLSAVAAGLALAPISPSALPAFWRSPTNHPRPSGFSAWQEWVVRCCHGSPAGSPRIQARCARGYWSPFSHSGSWWFVFCRSCAVRTPMQPQTSSHLRKWSH